MVCDSFQMFFHIVCLNVASPEAQDFEDLCIIAYIYHILHLYIYKHKPDYSQTHNTSINRKLHHILHTPYDAHTSLILQYLIYSIHPNTTLCVVMCVVEQDESRVLCPLVACACAALKRCTEGSLHPEGSHWPEQKRAASTWSAPDH